MDYGRTMVIRITLSYGYSIDNVTLTQFHVITGRTVLGLRYRSSHNL